MEFLFEGRDIAVEILRAVYHQDYRTAHTNSSSKCIGSEHFFKYPEYLVTDRYRRYFTLLRKVGLFTKEECWKYLDILDEKRRQIPLSEQRKRRKAFEAAIMHEAKRRRLECLYGMPEEMITRRRVQ